MKIIAIANQKGGCAKTSTVVNLAAALGEKKFKILIIRSIPERLIIIIYLCFFYFKIHINKEFNDKY